MKYSIIVPIFKIEAYLKECIESVLHQDFNDWELILVDDGSPDKCPVICDEHARVDNRIKVVHKPNGGLVSARKAGLEVARGEYAVCLDGDDFLHRNCLSVINKQIDLYTPDVLCFGYIIYSETIEKKHPILGFRYGKYDRTSMETELFPNLIHSKTENRLPPVVWSKVFRMDIYRKYQMKVSSEISMGEDGACSYPLICNANSVVLMEECLYYYRQVTTSMTKVKKPLKWDNYDKVFELYEQEIELDKLGLRTQVDRARTHNLFNLCMSQFYSDDSYAKVVSSINDRFAAHPEYDEAIKGSDFSSPTMKVVRLALKYKLYCLLKLYSKWK